MVVAVFWNSCVFLILKTLWVLIYINILSCKYQSQYICCEVVTYSILTLFLSCIVTYFADPGEARDCSTNTFIIHSLINSLSQPFPLTALRRRHAQTVRDSTSSYKIDYFIVIKKILNPEGHQNPISGSKVMVILLKGWIFPISGASSGRVCACTLHSRLVFFLSMVRCQSLVFMIHFYIVISFPFQKSVFYKSSWSQDTPFSLFNSAVYLRKIVICTHYSLLTGHNYLPSSQFSVLGMAVFPILTLCFHGTR